MEVLKEAKREEHQQQHNIVNIEKSERQLSELKTSESIGDQKYNKQIKKGFISYLIF